MMKGPINMAINPPVDATKTPEWAALQKHYDELQSEGISLKQWFADDAERVEKLSFDAGDLHFDLSKNLIKPETLQLFADLAKAVKLDERTKAMYTGVHINNTEDRHPVINPANAPATIPAKSASAGCPFKDTSTDITAPKPKLPSVVKSGISNILSEIYIPIASNPYIKQSGRLVK